MSYTSLFTKASLGGLALALGGCGTINQAVEANSLERPTYVAGETAKAVVEIGACDRLGFKVWENNATNRRTLFAPSLFPKTVEEYKGHLVEYNNVSLAKVGAVLGAAVGRHSVAGLVVGGVLAYAAGNELDKMLTPAQLMDLRACKNELDKKPAYGVRDYYNQAPVGRIRYNNQDLLGREIFVPR